MKLNGLEKYFQTENGEIVDFEQKNSSNHTPLMYAFNFNEEKNLNLNEEQWDYLIKKSNLSYFNSKGDMSINFAFMFSEMESLKLNEKQWDYLIKNSNLKQINQMGYTTLMYALRYNKTENVKLNNEQWKYIIGNSDISLITDKRLLIELKKIHSELLNEEILYKINIKEEINKNKKI